LRATPPSRDDNGTAVPVEVKIKTNVKGVGQECPTHTGKFKVKGPRVRDENAPTGIAENAAQGILRLRNHSALRSDCSAQDDNGGICLGEFDSVGLAEQVPGFAVGVVDVEFAAAFGA